MAKKSNAKSTIIFLLYNLIVTVFILFFIEITLQYLYRNPSKIPSIAIKAFAQFYSQIGRFTIQVEPECAEYNSSLFYLLKPGVCQFKNIEFETKVNINQSGLRDSEDALASPKIIFLGDSFTMGWGVEQNQSFPEVAGAKIKTLNAGMSSFGTARELMLLKMLHIDSAESIVIQYHANDAEENAEFIANNFNLKVSSQSTYDSICTVYRLNKKYYPGKYISNIGRFFLKDLIKPEELDKRNYDLEANNFLKVLSSFDELNLKKLIIFEIGSRNINNDHFINSLEQKIKDGAYPNGIKNSTLIRLQNILSSNDYFILDDHLNEKGHKKLGELLTSFIED